MSALILKMDAKSRNFLRLAYSVGYSSTDPSTKVGAVVSRKDTNIVVSANRFPDARSITEERRRGEDKNLWYMHAEAGAILNLLRYFGRAEEYDVLYCPWACCHSCADFIIAGGIKTVIAHKQAMQRTPQRWEKSIAVGLTKLLEAGVHYIQMDGEIGGVDSLMDWKQWKP